MKSTDQSSASVDPIVKKSNGKEILSGAGGEKPRDAVSSGNGEKLMASAFSAAQTYRSSKAAFSSDKVRFSGKVAKVTPFKDVSLGIQEGELRFRLIHFWEARNVTTKILIGLEMLLIDEEGMVMQGFIPAGRIHTYLPHLKVGSVYSLNKCFGSNSKRNYRVADPAVVISFTWNSVLSVVEESGVLFPDDRFRVQSYQEFDAACDLKGDLHDFIGHLKLVNGQTPSESMVLDEVEIASTRRILLHVQTHDDPVMKVYLWDQAAAEFCSKFKAQGNTPRVILITTVNPKRFGGVLSLASMSSSRVFLDFDVQPTRDYVTWLDSNLDVANRVNATVVTKTETATIADLFAYLKHAAAKVAWFECTATIDAVDHRSPWYYIGCGVCHTKAIKGPVSLMCKKCGKAEIVGVPQYLIKLSVYDRNDQADFVVIGEAGRELTGKHASELVSSYFEVNESTGDDHMIPTPQPLLDTIGGTYRFVVKVSDRNLTGQTQSLTVTKVLSLAAVETEETLSVAVLEEADDGKEETGSDLGDASAPKRPKFSN